MSDKNIKKIDNDFLKNNLQDNPIQNNLSPTKSNFSTNTEINHRNFPSKANFFKQNTSNKSNDKKKSHGNQSPLLNYYVNLSPNFSKNNLNYSPEQNFNCNKDNLKLSPYMSGSIGGEQNFNFSPRNIFNIGNQKNINNNMLVNNFNNNHPSGEFVNFNNNSTNNKSLAEKMEQLVIKNDDNNLLKNQNAEQKSDDEEDNRSDEMYMLALDICDDKDNEEELNNNSHIKNDNTNTNINQSNNITNNTNMTSITNNQNKLNPNQPINFNPNNIIQKPLEVNNENINNIMSNYNDISDAKNLKNNNENNQKNVAVKEEEDKSKKIGNNDKIMNANEMPKPFIPTKYRNNAMQINQINYFQDDSMLPSYGGSSINNSNNNLINNYTINNNINNNFNINNNVINNNLVGNQNFNMGYNNIGNNNMKNQGNNIMMNMNNTSPQMMKEKEISPYPTKIGEFLNFQNNIYMFNPKENNKFEMGNMNNFQNRNYLNNNNNFNNENNYVNNFYYKGDNYQISQFKQYKKSENSKDGQIRSICADDFVTAITANNKKIKRIDPNTYLNESLEYLSFNILPLAKDQAGCRFLQEKLDKEPTKATPLFFEAILPYILSLVKDPFGNYLIQKLCNTLNPDQIMKILEKISTTILDIGSNNHGTRVIQYLINYLTTDKLLNYFIKSIEPYVIPLLKELNGTHIIQQLLIKHPQCSGHINKIIVDNCASLASHSHGCCVLQKFLNGKDKNLKESLINNLINNCLVLIIDQYGNYVIQSILLLNESKSSAAIAMKIYDNVAYYSKHRYSSNVVEKCFDFCGKNERKKLAEKLSPPDILADLIMDEHGNYVIQKALASSELKEQEIILNNIIPLIPKIKTVSFGEKLLSRLMATYPQFKNNVQIMEGNNSLINNNNNVNNGNMNYNNISNNMSNNSGYNNYKRGNKKKKGVNNYNNTGANYNYNYYDNKMGYNNNNNNNYYYNNNDNNYMNNNAYFNNNEKYDDSGKNNNLIILYSLVHNIYLY